MIRVLQYIGSLEQGGSQAMIMNLYRNIDRTQVQFDFVVHDNPTDTPLEKEASALGARIYACPSFRISTVRVYGAWWNSFFRKHSEYKVVHSHVRSTAAFVLKIAKKYGCKTIAHSHSTSSGSGFRALVKNGMQHKIRYVADYFMGCSQVAGEWLFGKKVCGSSNYFNVPNAIEVEKYKYDASVALFIRKELGYCDTDILIGHVGRFSEPKNHAFLIDIFYELHKKNDKYKLLLVGDGELRTEIERKVSDLGLSCDVQFTGVRSDVSSLMMAMDIFLFPSKWEGLPVSVIEAQAAGLPCVISANITNEVSITPLVKHVSIEETSDKWGAVVASALEEDRKDFVQDISNTDYNILKSTVWITEFYKGLVTE